MSSYLIKKGSMVQRRCSDGGTMDKGEPERAIEDMAIYEEAVLCRPENYEGNWLFRIHSGLLFEIDDRYVNAGKVRWQNEGGGSKGESTEVLPGAAGE